MVPDMPALGLYRLSLASRLLPDDPKYGREDHQRHGHVLYQCQLQAIHQAHIYDPAFHQKTNFQERH